MEMDDLGGPRDIGDRRKIAVDKHLAPDPQNNIGPLRMGRLGIISSPKLGMGMGEGESGPGFSSFGHDGQSQQLGQFHGFVKGP